MLEQALSDPRIVGAVVAVFALLVLASRVRWINALLSLGLMAALAFVLVTVASERGRFDPQVGRLIAPFKLDRQEVVGRETRVPMSADGHFWVTATIDGVKRRMLVDSGATVTALAASTAAEAGLAARRGLSPVLLRTANGTVTAQSATVGELKLGNIVARDLAAVVSPAFGETNVVGMNFLSRLKSWRVEGRTLILVPNHPQPIKTG